MPDSRQIKNLITVIIVLALTLLFTWRVTTTKPVVIPYGEDERAVKKKLLAEGESLTIPKKVGFYAIGNDNLSLGDVFLRSQADPIATNSVDLASLSADAGLYSKFIPMNGGISLQQLNTKISNNKEAHKKEHVGIKSPMIDSAFFNVPEFKLHVVRNSQQHSEFSFVIEMIEKTQHYYLIDDDGLFSSTSIDPPSNHIFTDQAWLVFDDTQVTPSTVNDYFLGKRAISFTYEGDIKATLDTDKAEYKPGRITIRSWNLDENAVVGNYAVYQMDFGLSPSFNKVGYLKSGLYSLEHSVILEDQKLFEQSLKLGLIALQGTEIKIVPLGLSDVANGDGILMNRDWEHLISSWQEKNVIETYRRIHLSENGKYLKKQINKFNDRHKSGIAWRINIVTKYQQEALINHKVLPIKLLADSKSGEILTNDLSTRWDKWNTVSTNKSVMLKVMSEPETTFELMLISPKWSVEAGTVLHNISEVCKNSYCSDSIHKLVVKTDDKGFFKVKVDKSSIDLLAGLYAKDFFHIEIIEGKLQWFSQKARPTKNEGEVAHFKIKSIDGKTLFDNKIIIEPNGAYADILGIHAYRQHKLPGLISNDLSVDKNNSDILIDGTYQLTINDEIQTNTYALLADYARSKGAEFASFVLMGENGEIIAAPSYSILSNIETSAIKLIAIDDFFPSKNPTTFRAGVHFGEYKSKAASNIKPIISIAAGIDAPKKPLIDKLLKGMTYAEYDNNLELCQWGYNPNAAAYPLNSSQRGHDNLYSLNWLKTKCRARSPIWGVNNFRGISGYEMPARDGTFVKGDTKQGLVEHLRDSTNSYFALLIELTESYNTGPYEPGVIDMLPMSHEVNLGRPLYSVLNEFGFFDSINLTPNLSHGFETTKSIIHHPKNKTQLYRAATGSNTNVTPIVMAKFYNAIATGCINEPTLEKYEGVQCQKSLEDIGLKNEYLELIRSGLYQVVQNGTAKTSFKGFDGVGSVYAKTGTEIWFRTKNKKEERNTVWMSGFIKDNGRVLTFVCMLSGVPNGSTGGKTCGPLVRKILETEEVQSLLSKT